MFGIQTIIICILCVVGDCSSRLVNPLVRRQRQQRDDNCKDNETTANVEQFEYG